MKKYVINRGCTLCETCVFSCPAQAITLGMNGAQIEPDKCTGCGACYDNCASEAITCVEGGQDEQNNNNGEGEK